MNPCERRTGPQSLPLREAPQVGLCMTMSTAYPLGKAAPLAWLCQPQSPGRRRRLGPGLRLHCLPLPARQSSCPAPALRSQALALPVCWEPGFSGGGGGQCLGSSSAGLQCPGQTRSLQSTAGPLSWPARGPPVPRALFSLRSTNQWKWSPHGRHPHQWLPSQHHYKQYS